MIGILIVVVLVLACFYIGSRLSVHEPDDMEMPVEVVVPDTKPEAVDPPSEKPVEKRTKKDQ